MKKILFLLFSALSLQITAQTFKEEGLGSCYNDSFQGKATASGEKYDKNAYTGAHKTLPFGTKVMVTRLDNNKSIMVRINDRGGFAKGHVIDLSRHAAEDLGLIADGSSQVKVRIEVQEEEKEEPKETKINLAPSKGETQGLYKIQVLKLNDEKGYGVQIATYSSYDGVLNHVASLQDEWFKNIMVFVSGEGEHTNYKVILGPFFDEPTADSYQKNVKKKYKIDCFVVSLKDLDKGGATKTEVKPEKAKTDAKGTKAKTDAKPAKATKAKGK